VLKRVQFSSDEAAVERGQYETSYSQDVNGPVQAKLQAWRIAAEGNDDDAVDLVWLLRILRRNRWRIISALLISLAAGLTYIELATPQFRATAQLYLDTREAPLVDLSGRMQLPAENSLVDSQLEIIQSPRIAEIVLKTIGSGAGSKTYTRGRQAREITEEGRASDVEIVAFQRKLAVERKGSTNIVEVSFTDPSSERAAAIVNAIVRTYLEAQIESGSSAVEVKRRALQKEVSALRKEVKRIEEAIQNIQIETKLAAAPEAGFAERQLADIAQQLAIARAQREAISARLRKINTAAAAPFAGRKETENFELQAGSGYANRENPNGENREKQKLEDELTVATRNASELEDAFGKMQQKVADYQKQSIALGELERQAVAARAVYSSLLTRLREAEAQENLVMPSAQIVFSARPPEKPSYPDIPMTLLISLAGGSIIGIAWVGWREASNDAFRSLDDVERHLGEPVVACLPHIASSPAKRGRRVMALKGKSNSVAESSDSPALGDRAKLPQLLALSEAPEAMQYAQALFLIKCNIASPADPPRVVAICSPKAGDGKSSLALNLGAYTASTGLRTLVVDCDTRKPDLSNLLAPSEIGGGGCAPGLVRDGAGPALRATKTALDFEFCAATSALSTPFPMDRASSPALRHFITSSRHTHDVVLIDTAPLLDYVDARAIVPIADAILLVIDWCRTSQSEAARAMKIIAESGGQRVGIIAKDPKRRRFRRT